MGMLKAPEIVKRSTMVKMTQMTTVMTILTLTRRTIVTQTLNQMQTLRAKTSLMQRQRLKRSRMLTMISTPILIKTSISMARMKSKAMANLIRILMVSLNRRRKVNH